MGVGVETWRQRIGSFSQPKKRNPNQQTLSLNKSQVSLCIRIVLFLLLSAIGGVEPNPGPRGRRDSVRGKDNATRGQGGAGRGSTSDPEVLVSSQRATRNSQSQRNVQNRRNSIPQPTLNEWFQNDSANAEHLLNENAEHCVNDEISESEETPSENVFTNEAASINGIEILLDIQKHVKCLDTRFEIFEKAVNNLTLEQNKLIKENAKLNETVKVLSDTVLKLEQETCDLKLKNEQLESQSRRENLKFYELNESQKETWDDTESKVRQYIRDELGMDETDMKFERVHRLPGKQKPRPIIAKFSFFKDKDRVLKKYREKNRVFMAENNDRDESVRSKVRVSEDFPERIRKVRGQLIPFLKDAIKEGKSAHLRYDKLIVDGKAFIYDEATNLPVPSYP